LESARAFTSGSESWEVQPTGSDSRLAPENLVEIHEDARMDEDMPTPITAYQGWGTQTDERAAFDYDNGLENTCIKRSLSSDTALDDDKDTVDKEQAIKESDGLRRNVRSKEVWPRGVAIGRVAESGIAQRRKTTSNMSM